jgi:FkbM family methyltransferase
MTISIGDRTSIPWVTFDYLRRDGDPPSPLWKLAMREWRECAAELRATVALAAPYEVLPLAFWIMAYHAGMSLHPMASRRQSKLGLGVHGHPLTILFRRNQSDLYILRENFVQRIYEFDYESVLGGSAQTIVDLGANIGLSSLYLQARFPSAQLLCVEPVDANVDMLRQNAAANDFSWLIESAAVTAESGTVSLFPNEWWSSSSITPHVAQARAGNTARLENVLQLPCQDVEGATVTDLLNRNAIDTVDIMKMDIEGAEADVLAGSTNWLERVRVLIIEIHKKYVDEEKIVAHLARAGFRRAPGRTGPTDVFIRD